MEVIDTPFEKNRFAISSNQESRPIKCIKKYIQPPRAKPFIPQTTYCPSKSAIESKTTYHCSFYHDQMHQARPKPILPIHSITLPEAKFSNDTTTKLSFKPVWGLYRSKAIKPHQRLCSQRGPMANITTIRQDYAPKIGEKPEPIRPCGNIRTSKGMFDTATTTLLSYINPGPVEPVTSFKPQMKYSRPMEPTSNVTTQKLSYLPYEIGKKENYPWARKPIYRRPDVQMNNETTYTKSYFENKVHKEEPILPKDTFCILSCDNHFNKSTVYQDSFIPCKTDPVTPILPCPNISLSEKKMMCDTTSKLSFQPVKGEKRKPILPRSRKILCDTGFSENITTNQLEFVPKITKRMEMIIPCGNIQTNDEPLEDKTTTALSFVNPGPAIQITNYKPITKYCRPKEKIENNTVSKLSYLQWALGPKEDMPWARKQKYQAPSDKIATNTIYHMSFPPPGYYIEECRSVKGCECASNDVCNH